MTEFVFGPHSSAEAFCRRMGWRPYGRASWRKPDGTVVYFACFIEQLEAGTKGMTVHVVGRHADAERVLKVRGAGDVQLSYSLQKLREGRLRGVAHGSISVQERQPPFYQLIQGAESTPQDGFELKRLF